MKTILELSKLNYKELAKYFKQNNIDFINQKMIKIQIKELTAIKPQEKTFDKLYKELEETVNYIANNKEIPKKLNAELKRVKESHIRRMVRYTYINKEVELTDVRKKQIDKMLPEANLTLENVIDFLNNEKAAKEKIEKDIIENLERSKAKPKPE